MSEQTPLVLLLNAKDAAKSLGIGERLLWSMTAPRGPIQSVRLGRRVLYSVAALEAFVTAKTKGGAQ